jgi:hypothetical protein
VLQRAPLAKATPRATQSASSASGLAQVGESERKAPDVLLVGHAVAT